MNDPTVQRLCHMLGSCEETVRTTALGSIAKLFKRKEHIEELELSKICKALYYMLWLTDKPINVRRIAVSVVELQDEFPDRDKRFLFFRTLFRSLSMEWSSLDKNRMDKMLLFVRIAVAALLGLLNSGNWNYNEIDHFRKIVIDDQGIFNARSPGLAFQFIHTFLEEMEGNMKELKEEWSPLDAMGYLRLIAPFLHLVIRLENKQLVSSISIYVLNKINSIEGIPYQAVVRAMEMLAVHSQIRGARKKIFAQAVHGIKDVVPSPMDNEIEAIINSILEEPICNGDKMAAEKVNGAMDAPTALVNEAHQNGAKVHGDVMAPELVDISDELDVEVDQGDIDPFEMMLNGNTSCSRLGRLKEIELLERLRRKMIARGEENNGILAVLNSPRFRMQRYILSLYNMKKLRSIWKFKHSKNLDRIRSITETTVKPAPKKPAIDVSKALHNIKHAQPGKSIVRKRNRKPTEQKSVVFNLNENKIATIPKKKRSTFSMPMWY